MASNRWVLPEGVEELLSPEAERLEALRRDVLDLYRSWGYELVIPPFIEFIESLLTGTGRDLDLQTFKLIDQLSGRLMGVRADMTPQVARIDAHHLRRDVPTRFCYTGTVLHTLPDGLERSRAPVQAGAELYGHEGVESDCEIVCLMIETLRRAGLAQVYLDLGHVGIFRVLARAARIEGDDENELYDIVQRKARPDLKAMLKRLKVPAHHAGALSALVDLHGDQNILAQAREQLGLDRLGSAGAEIVNALERLEALALEVAWRLPGLSLHFDLGELRGYRYHTGVVFAAFLPGHGEEVARGGRYDHIGEVFGRGRAATGFSVDLKTLVGLAVHREPAEKDHRIIWAPWVRDPELLSMVAELRGQGHSVRFELPGAGSEAGEGRRLYRKEQQWVVSDNDG